jgi:CBS domain-containing protein
MVGLFSGHNYARASIRATQSPTAIPVRAVMTPCDISVNPADSVHKCLSLMLQNSLRHLPVQEEGTLIAVLSLDDLLYEMVAYLERVFRENELDQQIVFLRGTYSC